MRKANVEFIDWSVLAENLGTVGRLSEIRLPSSQFFKRSKPLNRFQRLSLIGQAKLMFEEAYVHRPLKRERRAVDAVAALRQLERRVRDKHEPSDIEFHAALQVIFKSLKDVHTTYIAPPPYATAIAFLPFTVESYFEEGEGHRDRRFIVADVAEGLSHRWFKQGIEITHWNGAPIEAVVRQIGESGEGSNAAAGFALGQKFLTVRWLGVSPPPIEDWVDLTIARHQGPAYLRLPWLVLKLNNRLDIALQAVWALEKEIFPASAGRRQSDEDSTPPMGNAAHNQRTLVEHSVRKLVFAPQKHREHSKKRRANAERLKRLKSHENRGAYFTGIRDRPKHGSNSKSATEIESLIPEVFEARSISAADEQLGYIRIRHFRHGLESSDDVGFAREFQRLLGLVPTRGLIVDIRGNPGGWVECAERILQFLTPVEISPLPFQFPATPLIEAITDPDSAPGSSRGENTQAVDQFRKRLVGRWSGRVREATSTGALYTTGIALTTKEAANDTGQRYFGPVTLIFDAITYSAGDIFAASFQDHGIGTVIGVDECTGGGGANVWSHRLLQNLVQGDGALKELPYSAQMSFAARRCVRVLGSSGTPIEEVAVHADKRHWTTKNDLLNKDADLLALATKILLKKPKREFTPQISRSGENIQVAVPALGIDRVDVFCNGAPVGPSLFPNDAKCFLHSFKAPTQGRQRIELHGYDGATNQLVARFKQVLTQSVRK